MWLFNFSWVIFKICCLFYILLLYSFIIVMSCSWMKKHVIFSLYVVFFNAYNELHKILMEFNICAIK